MKDLVGEARWPPLRRGALPCQDHPGWQRLILAETAVPPILRGLLRCCALLLGELGKHDVEGKIADPCVAGKEVPFCRLYRICLHHHAIRIEPRAPILSNGV